MRILIVDDNADIRLMVRMQLEVTAGVEAIAEATNGVEAIEQASIGNPDVVILDIDMPVMSGDVALPILRSVAPRACIVVHTATSQAAGPRPGVEPADAYLLKLRDDVGEFVATMVAERAQVA